MLIRALMNSSSMLMRSPDGEGGSPPSPALAPAPTPPPPTPTPTPAPGAPPSGNAPAPGDPLAGDPPAPDPVAEAAAAALAARAFVPESAEGYALHIPEALSKAMPAEAMAKDPMIVALREHYKANGRSQGEFDNLFEALGVLREKNLLSDPFDFAAERAALGENGLARQQEIETWGQALKSRGDIDDAEFGELMSLAPTAAGVRLVEKLRKMTGQNGNVLPPRAADSAGDENAAQKEARTMARDPKYATDRTFREEADAKWKAAFG